MIAVKNCKEHCGAPIFVEGVGTYLFLGKAINPGVGLFLGYFFWGGGVGLFLVLGEQRKARYPPAN